MAARFLVALIALALLGGCTLQGKSTQTVAPSPSPTVIATAVPTAIATLHTIKGSLLIQPGYHYESSDDLICISGCGTDGAPCTGIGPYADLRTDTQVTVRDANGAIVAIGALKTGSLEVRKDAPYWGRCRLPLEIDGVPEATFYSVSIGTRPGITYSHDQLDSLNWRLALTVGDPDW